MSDDQLRDLLRLDPLAEAERVTGKPYKSDEPTLKLGMALHLMHGKAKEDALRRARDSYFSMNLADTLTLYQDLGFTEALCDEFTGHGWGGAPDPVETFRILWREDGVLATVESHQTTRRNSTKIYYNIRFRGEWDWGLVSSGHMEGGVWVGDHDAREGLRYTLNALASAGDFLNPWVERPFLWFVAYSESEGDYDHKAITEERISRLPANVRKAIR